jgi:hypothetical protein
MSRSRSQELQHRRILLLSRMRSLVAEPLMRGSIVERTRRCGKPNCACARDPKARHGGLYLSVHLDGTTQAVHLRPEDVEPVRDAIERYQRLWETIDQMTACQLAELRYAASERRRGRTRRRA